MAAEARYEAIIETIKGKGIKIWTHKQMLQRLQIALAQGKAENISNNFIYLLIYS